jgi:hypothetical protein
MCILQIIYIYNVMGYIACFWIHDVKEKEASGGPCVGNRPTLQVPPHILCKQKFQIYTQFCFQKTSTCVNNPSSTTTPPLQNATAVTAI